MAKGLGAEPRRVRERWFRLVAAVVAEEGRGLVVVGDEEVQVPIPVVVEAHDAAALAGVVEA